MYKLRLGVKSIKISYYPEAIEQIYQMSITTVCDWPLTFINPKPKPKCNNAD